MSSLNRNQTWTLVPRSHTACVLSNRRVFRRKHIVLDHGREGVKFIARLVTSGFQQVGGINYIETFAFVVRVSTLRLFLSIEATENLELDQINVKTAFLNGDLNEEIENIHGTTTRFCNRMVP